MNDSAQIQAQGSVSREKYWEEMNDTEKLNWLYRSITGLKGRVENRDKLLNHLSNHSHTSNGEIQVPLRNVY